MSYITLTLRAIKPDTNVNRVYTVHLCAGLFDSWCVITAFGRYGAGARQRVHSFFTCEEAKAFVMRILKKRVNAEKRIGCNYTLVKRSASGDFKDACLLPDSLSGGPVL